MSTKPEALRLADHIEDGYYGHCPQAAAELRRLHAQSLADEDLLRMAVEALSTACGLVGLPPEVKVDFLVPLAALRKRLGE